VCLCLKIQVAFVVLRLCCSVDSTLGLANSLAKI
jgi:hypothetical protein